MSFSAHADSKGILNLIKHCEPENVVLVHGEKNRMEVFSEVVREMLNIPCYYPANFEDLYIPVKPKDQSYPLVLGRSFTQLDFNADNFLLLIKKGDGIASRQVIEKEFFIRTRKPDAIEQQKESTGILSLQAEEPDFYLDESQQKTSGTELMKTGESMEEEKEYRILPHKIVKLSLKDFK
jgi:Zn-dependent metallo-hydrolase RNA specificity domain